MIAITSGLNTPPIRRLKRTWEQVNQRAISQFAACELTIDSSKTFAKYRQLMSSIEPPCVPFIGELAGLLAFLLLKPRIRCLPLDITVHCGWKSRQPSTRQPCQFFQTPEGIRCHG